MQTWMGTEHVLDLCDRQAKSNIMHYVCGNDSPVTGLWLFDWLRENGAQDWEADLETCLLQVGTPSFSPPVASHSQF